MRNSNREDDVAHLEERFEALSTRIQEHGVDVVTEAKMSQWQEVLTRELRKIEGRLEQEVVDLEGKGIASLKLTALERAVDEIRRDSEAEKTGMRTLVQCLRRQISTIEVDVTEVLKRQKKIEAKLIELDQDMTDLSRDQEAKRAEMKDVRMNIEKTESQVKDV